MENNRHYGTEIGVTSVIAFGTGTILSGLAKAVVPPQLSLVARLAVGATVYVATQEITTKLTDYVMDDMLPIYCEIGQDIKEFFKNSFKKEKVSAN